MRTRALLFGAVLVACASCGRLKSGAAADASPDAGDAAADAETSDAAPDADGAPAPDADAAVAPDADASSDGADAGLDGADVAIEAAAGTPLTAAVTATIDLPGIPVAAAYNAGTKKAYFACGTPAGASAGVAVVDDGTNAVVATIATAAAVTSLAANSTTKIVYGAEGAQVDVIDSASDTISTTVKISDGSTIVGLGVDELHDQTYVVTTTQGMTELFVIDGATGMLQSRRPPLLTPAGMPPVAIDGASQSVFVLGVDSNLEGEIVTLDGPSGAATGLAAVASKVDPSVSGIVSLGDGRAAILLVKPGLVRVLPNKDFGLPAALAPAGIAACNLGGGPVALVVGFGASGGLEGYGVDATTGALSPFGVPLAGGVPAGTTAARMLAAASLTGGGCEIYVDPTPDPNSAAAFSPTRTIKLTIATAPL
jgi:hypothetical protein